MNLEQLIFVWNLHLVLTLIAISYIVYYTLVFGSICYIGCYLLVVKFTNY